MTKKIYLETSEKCPGLVYFPILKTNCYHQSQLMRTITCNKLNQPFSPEKFETKVIKFQHYVVRKLRNLIYLNAY